MLKDDHDLVRLKERKRMAHPEHLDLLKQGATIWNQWRAEHPEIEPNLTHVDFDGIDLTKVNLSGTDLRGSSLVAEVINGMNRNYSEGLRICRMTAQFGRVAA
jgi:hypothetical protein